MVNCEFCNKEFKNNKTLNAHKKNVICNSLEKTKEQRFKCEKCNKILSSKQRLNTHSSICNSTPLEVMLLQEKNKNLMNQNVEYKNQIKDLQDKLEKLASQAINRPTTTNNSNTTNTNNIMNLAPLDMNVLTEKLKTVINENMTEQHLLEGQEGIAKLIASCFTLEDGRKLITCTDTSRGIWKSKDNNGNILKDVKANNIAKTVQPLAVSKADVLIDLDGKKRNKIYELRDIEKRKKERLELDEKDKSTMKGMKPGSGHYRMYEERLRKRSEESEKDNELEEELLEEFREADELYLINLEDDEKPFKLYAGKEEIKNLKEDSIKFSNSLITLV
jgi:hypothetical protein